MASPFFRFKQFTIWHDRCAMKVGTDGVLLGAWCPIPIENPSNTFNILDIGTGSGLIALMLAQRAPYALITAIDIDQKAVEQAQYNFSISPWKERLECHLSALQQVEGEELFDLIVSNPPYFQDSLKNPDNQRAMARHTDTLSYEELLSNSARLLKQQATLALVLPIEAEPTILARIEQYNLLPTHITHVYTKPGKEAKRLLITLIKSDHKTNKENTCIYTSLTLESATSPRSEEYKNLTQEFYL